MTSHPDTPPRTGAETGPRTGPDKGEPGRADRGTGTAGTDSSPTPPADPGRTRAELRLATRDLSADLAFFTGRLGMRLETIFPADDPRVAVVAGHGLQLRLERGAPEPPATLRLLAENPAALAPEGQPLHAPNGTRIEIAPLVEAMAVPPTVHEYAVRKLADRAPWVIGRAGMHYRDLVPSRLGGSIIASHIRIPDGGPVPDMVHYHTVGFQLIFCYRGWVDLVYEDQGPPFRLLAGNCVIQPPGIRHRVLYASDNIEVIEIGVPAEHVTTIDHTMTLPNGPAQPDRLFDGQRFVHHRADAATWAAFRIPGLIARDTTIGRNTGGVAGVHVIRPAPVEDNASRNGGAGATTPAVRHHGDILFCFVTEGRATLHAQGHDPAPLAAGDAFVIPPGLVTHLADMQADFELLEVALPACFETEVLPARP